MVTGAWRMGPVADAARGAGGQGRGEWQAAGVAAVGQRLRFGASVGYRSRGGNRHQFESCGGVVRRHDGIRGSNVEIGKSPLDESACGAASESAFPRGGRTAWQWHPGPVQLDYD